MDTPKRKTSTSWQVKARYNNKHYKRIAVDLDKELVIEWETKLAEKGISKSEFVRNAIRQFLAAE